MRIISDGENLTAAYSYNGNTFTPVGRPVSLATFADAKIGPAALSAEAPTVPVARFDWIRFDPDGSGGGGSEGIVDNFDGTELGAAWSRVRPTQAAVVGSGTLQIPARPGDIYQTRNDAQDLIVRDAPDGAWQAITKINFEGTAQYQQAGIMVYGNDDNFTKFGRIAHTAAGDEKFEFINEVNAVARNEAADSTAERPGDLPEGLLAAADVRRDQRGRPLLDRRDHVDPGRASGGAAGGRQDRPVRVLQRRRGQPGRGLRLLHPHR